MNKPNNYNDRLISFMQIGSMLGIWGLLIFIIWWLSNSIKSAFAWQDIPTATIIITFIAMIVFIILVSILTYVFVGLRFGREEPDGSGKNGDTEPDV